MSMTLSGSALPRRLASVLIAALFGLTLALNPMSAPNANAAVSAKVGIGALHVAAAQVGVRYRYGGTSPRTGFDCSGLTQYSYARVGKHLPRVAQQQYRATIRVSRSAARPGNLVSFYSGHSMYHVGIYAGRGYMYDAPHTGTRVKKQRIWTTHVLFGRVR
jgi:cell wall-associated NlpC family hydrolase